MMEELGKFGRWWRIGDERPACREYCILLWHLTFNIQLTYVTTADLVEQRRR